MRTIAPTQMAKATMAELEAHYTADRPAEGVDIVFDTFERISKSNGAIPLPDMPTVFNVSKAGEQAKPTMYYVHVMWFRATDDDEEAFTAIIYDAEANTNLMCDNTDKDYPNWLEHRVSAILDHVRIAGHEKASILYN